MRQLHLGFIGVFCLTVSCAESLSPEAARDIAFSDINALQVKVAFAQSAYTVDGPANFSFSVRNDRPRDAIIYGTCIMTLELQNMAGAVVFPSGARPCSPPVETFRVGARDSTVGSISMSGALGNPDAVGLFALPEGTFRMRVVLQGVTDLTTYNFVRVASDWSDPFTVTQ
jgi:hypothetical protein